MYTVHKIYKYILTVINFIFIKIMRPNPHYILGLLALRITLRLASQVLCVFCPYKLSNYNNF